MKTASRLDAFSAYPDRTWILVRSRLEEPVERGPAIPVAFVLGTVTALGLFCASVFFPAGLMVFALVVCGARIVYFDV